MPAHLAPESARLSHRPLPLPLAIEAVPAGFPSPADDYIDGSIDLHAELVPSPLSTFFMRVEGDCMRGQGILHGDLLVIDRSLSPRHGSTVVATCDGQFIVRRLETKPSHLPRLVACDGESRPIPLGQEGSGAEIWGVVAHAIHHLGRTPTHGS